ncbi:MAG: phosphoenolpyruvate--protein phosphotransferase [Monoglobaceae bacterium]
MKILNGIAGAPGVVFGEVLYFNKKIGCSKKMSIDEAVEKSLEKVRKMYDKALSDLGEDKAKIFSAYEMLLEDEMFIGPIKEMIEAGSAPEDAVTEVSESMSAILLKKENEYLRQRADDIRNVGNMIKETLCGADSDFVFPEGNDKYIIAAQELTPVDTMLFDHSRLLGFATKEGGATSHTVILAKSIGIPAVVGVPDLDGTVDLKRAYLDGYSGKFVVEPDEETKKIYDKKVIEEQEFIKSLETIKQNDAYTKDGERIKVAINIGKPSDLNGVENQRYDGVGLFRSEFLYSSSKEKPSVNQQYEAYKKVIDSVYPESVTIRTLDVGGDKQIEYFNVPKEENPFLGNRGIRLCLSNESIFMEQLKALLMAGADKKLKIMLPMVTRIEEITRTRELMEKAKKELELEGVAVSEDMELGIMIETPASAIMSEVFAKYCDFFSIGTNDLVQYIMSADRGNSAVENIYNPYNPAVLRMLNKVINDGAKAGIEVSVCGDLAANADFTEILLGMGLKKFSVPLPMINRIKKKISDINLSSAQELVKEVLSAEDENEVIKIIRKG